MSPKKLGSRLSRLFWDNLSRIFTWSLKTLGEKHFQTSPERAETFSSDAFLRLASLRVVFMLRRGKLLARSRPFRFALLIQDNLPYSACHASAQTSGCGRHLFYASKPSLPHSRHVPHLRHSAHAPGFTKSRCPVPGECEHPSAQKCVR